MTLSRFLSQKLRFFTFACIALLVYVHGYNLAEAYITPVTHVSEPLTFTSFIEYLFANGLLRFRIPMLFMISGFLYAWYDNRPYLERTKKRFVTLMIPYLIWSAFGLLLTYLLQQSPVTAKAVFNSQLDQMGDNRPYVEIGWPGIIKRWLWVPVSFQLWFVFSLFVYNIFYPVIRWLVVKIPYIWLPVAFLLWFTYFNFFIEGQGLFYFSMGVFIQKKNISMEQPPKWFAQGLFWILFFGLCVIKTFMAFELEPNAPGTFFALWILYNFTILAGVIAIWYGVDPIIEWCMNKKWFRRASTYSFFIYGFHIPFMAYFMRLAFMYLHNVPEYRLICYILVPASTVLLSIVIGKVIRKILPPVYKVMTGGRGI